MRAPNFFHFLVIGLDSIVCLSIFLGLQVIDFGIFCAVTGSFHGGLVSPSAIISSSQEYDPKTLFSTSVWG
jgi:hypothetical protein